MRVCLVTREYPPLSLYSGGIGTQLAALAPALAREGHEVVVLAQSPDASRTVTQAGVRVHLLPERRPRGLYVVSDVLWGLRVDRAARRLQPFDVVLLPEWRAEGWRLARRPGRPTIVTQLHTSLAQIEAMSPVVARPTNVRLHDAIQRRLERDQAQRSDAVVAPTAAMLAWARRLWSLDDLPGAVLPNMVDVKRIRALAAGPLPEGLPQGGRLVVFAGRLEFRKGVHVLVDAMHELWEEGSDVHLVMMGRDTVWEQESMEDRLRRAAGRHGSRLQLLGPQPPERLLPVLAAADVVALPSLWENFSLVALEAISAGCALVATTGSGYEEFLTDGTDALLVAPGESRPLAAAVQRLLDDAPERARLGAAAAQRARSFDVGTVGPQWSRYLSSL